MAGGTDNDETEITGINVTPLVDVMLVLLIIFMVTATYIVNQSINVQLPKAETSDTTEKSKNLGFVLDAQSQLYVDGKPARFEDIESLVAAAKMTAGAQPVNALISADKATPHGAVVKLIDAVRKYGITDFAINVESGTESP
jgi:biopolymer transport protein ExbD